MNNKFDITDTDLHENTERVCNDLVKKEDGNCKYLEITNSEKKEGLCMLGGSTHFLCNYSLKLLYVM